MDAGEERAARRVNASQQQTHLQGLAVGQLPRRAVVAFCRGTHAACQRRRWPACDASAGCERGACGQGGRIEQHVVWALLPQLWRRSCALGVRVGVCHARSATLWRRRTMMELALGGAVLVTAVFVYDVTEG